MIPVFRPCFGEEELTALREVFASGWIGLGPRTREFEERFARYIEVPHAVAVNSATAALHLALRIADVANAEVISSSLTFVSTNHAILYCGGVPVFADIEADTLNLDPAEIVRKITPRTKAIVVVHYGGHSCDMDPILAAARAHGLTVIEDCAHGCGGSYNDRMLGSLGHFGCFSFHAIKNLSTGDGGMITTSNPFAAERLRKLSWLGISRGTWERVEGRDYSWNYDVEELGFKCHMNDIAAALGIVQLGKLERTNGRRRLLAQRYQELLDDLDWLERPIEKSYARSAWHNYVVKVSDPNHRDALVDHLKALGISSSVHYVPNHLYRLYAPYAPEPLPVTESVWRRLVTLPLYPDLTFEEQDRVVSGIRSFVPRHSAVSLAS